MRLHHALSAGAIVLILLSGLHFGSKYRRRIGIFPPNRPIRQWLADRFSSERKAESTRDFAVQVARELNAIYLDHRRISQIQKSTHFLDRKSWPAAPSYLRSTLADYYYQNILEPNWVDTNQCNRAPASDLYPAFCQVSSLGLAEVLAEFGVRSRQWHCSDSVGGPGTHQFVEVFNPVTRTWFAIDPYFGLVYEDRESGQWLSVKMIRLLSRGSERRFQELVRPIGIPNFAHEGEHERLWSSCWRDSATLTPGLTYPFYDRIVNLALKALKIPTS